MIAVLKPYLQTVYRVILVALTHYGNSSFNLWDAGFTLGLWNMLNLYQRTLQVCRSRSNILSVRVLGVFESGSYSLPSPLILQSDLGRVPRASGAMTALGACLMATTPVGPGVDVLEVIVVTDTDDRGDQSTDLWDSQWDTLWLFAGLLIGAPFAASLARTTTRIACISRASVT